MLYSVNTSVATDKVGLERGIELLIDAGFPALDHTVMPDFSYAIGKDALTYAKKLKDYAASRGENQVVRAFFHKKAGISIYKTPGPAV